MDRSSALVALSAITAGLSTTEGTSEADLLKARSALAASLLKQTDETATSTPGLPLAPPRSPSSADTIELGRLLDQAATSTGPTPLAVLRSLPAPVLGNAALTPTATAGMLPQSIGPFADQIGGLHWVDIFPPLEETGITRAAAATPFLVLPLATGTGAVPTTLTVGAGSLWIEAGLLAPNAPQGAYAGIAIKGGTLVFSAAATQQSGGLQVNATTELTLTVTLGGWPGPIGGGNPGADGGAVVADVPSQVTFVFTPTTASVTASGRASMTAYGTTVGLVWHNAPAIYEPALAQILIPYQPQSAQFATRSVLSALFRPTGTAPITAAAWALPVAVATPAQLGTAATAGALALAMGPGLRASWKGSAGAPVGIGGVFLEAAGGVLSLLATMDATSLFGTSINLWTNNASGAPANTVFSSIGVGVPRGAALYYTSIAAYAGASHVEILSCGAIIAANIDRPVAADGSRLGPALLGTFTIFETATLGGVVIAGKVPASAPPAAPIALALRNALLVTTPPSLLLVAGRFTATPTELASGGLLLVFGMEAVLPTLPDPYAANFLPVLPAPPAASGNAVAGVPPSGSAATPSSALLAFVTWGLATGARVNFGDSALTANNLQVRSLTASPAAPQPPSSSATAAAQDQAWQAALLTLFNNSLGGSKSPALFLLDVSSNIDQFGVGMAVERPDLAARLDPGGALFAIAGLDLVASSRDLRVFTVPPVHWEPVVTIQNKNVLPSPFPSPAGFVDSGGPMLLGVNDVTFVPVAPAPLLSEVLSGYAGGKAGSVLFPMPFGMVAVVAVPERPATAPASFQRPGLEQVQPAFPVNSMAGGNQISLTAVAGNSAASLPGAAVQLRNLVDKNGNPLLDNRPPPPPPGGLQLSVLGPDVDETFNADFAPGVSGALVPVSRIDFSGYGASAFSDWVDPGAVPPAVVQAHFNILVGRTSREVVQVRSTLCPWGAIVVRTITIDRRANGQVYRHDSGWVAATPGLFESCGITVHPGAVRGAYNIREIRDTSQTYTSGALVAVGVYFDADLDIAGVTSGAYQGRVPSTGLFGWVQTEPAHVPLTAAQMAGLITAEGAPGGPVDCVIAIAGTAQTMRVLRVEVDNAPHPGAAETHEFAVAARGSLLLPQPGNWSVLTRTDSVSEPAPVDPDRGIPLIQQGAAGGAAGTMPWRLAEPVDLWVPDSPSMDYCLLHATDATRILFPRPVIASGANAFTSDQTPLLADGFALMNSTFVCPRQDSCLGFPNANYALQIGDAGDFTLANVPASFPPSLPRRSLAADSAGAVWFEYADGAQTPNPTQISVAINSTSWSVALAPINVRVDITPFDGIMRTVGGFTASSASGVSFQNSQFVLGSVLLPLQELLAFLSELGFPNPFALAFSNSGSQQSYSYKLSAGLGFTLPNNALVPILTPVLQPPGGPWKIGLSMKVGFGNTMALTTSSTNTTTTTTITEQWSFYFNIGGNMQWAVIPGIPLYVGFLLGFGVSHQFPSGSTPESTQLSFQLGGIASLGGDLIPGLVKAQVSLSLALSLSISNTSATSTSQATSSIAIGLILTLSVSASIPATGGAEGLFAISLSAEASGTIIDVNPSQSDQHLQMQATFGVSVDVSICWFINVSFSETIQYTQTLPTASL